MNARKMDPKSWFKDRRQILEEIKEDSDIPKKVVRKSLYAKS